MASLLSLLSPFVSGLQSFTGLNLNQLAGGGLLAGSALTGQEPGSVTEARQFLRNRFTSPLALSEQFGTQIKGLADQFQPLLTQQRQRGLSDIQERFVQAFPASVGAQPREFTALGRYLTEQALPREQAVLGDLGLNLLGAQERAATSLLGENAQNQLAGALGLVGGSLLANGGTTNIAIGGQGGTGGGGTTLLDQTGRSIGQVDADGRIRPMGGTGGGGVAGGGRGQSLLSNPSLVGQLTNLSGLFTGNQALQQGLGLIPGAAEGAFSTLSPEAGAAFVNAVSQALGGSAIGAFEQVGGGAVAVLDQSGSIIGGVLPTGEVLSGTTGQVVGNLGAGAGTSLASAVLPALGIAGTGLGIGLLGSRVGQNQFQSSGLGAAGGAASGALLGSTIFPGVGTAIGAIVGGLSGLLGGLFGERSQQQAIKAQFRSQDVDSQRDQVFEIGNIGATFLQRFGIDQAGMDAWASRVNTLAANVESPAAEQDMLAGELRTELTRLLGGEPSQKAPQLRQEFIDYMVQNTFTAGNSSFGGGAPQNLIPIWATQAGLRRGGVTTRRVHVVGESGPELLISKPGTAVVVPLLSRRSRRN